MPFVVMLQLLHDFSCLTTQSSREWSNTIFLLSKKCLWIFSKCLLYKTAILEALKIYRGQYGQNARISCSLGHPRAYTLRGVRF